MGGGGGVDGDIWVPVVTGVHLWRKGALTTPYLRSAAFFEIL